MSRHPSRVAVAILLALLSASASLAAHADTAACEAYVGPAPSSFKAYEGITHEHSSYSDGDPHTTPDDYYRLAKDHGYDFLAGSEHSDSLDDGDFATLHASCDPSQPYFDPTATEYCFLNPTGDKLQKWNSTLSLAQGRSSSSFFAIRGFEWTSDVFGHINVYFSKNFSNAKDDGGYAATMQTFWDWFTRDPASSAGTGGAASSPTPFGGGADGLAHFNHPHDKCTLNSDPTGATTNDCDWNDYTLIPAAVERMFGIEAFNDSNRNDRYQPYLARALDKGWRLSFLGSEDDHFAKYAVEEHPKTVTLARSLDEAGFREAWLARRTYALSPGKHLRVAFDAEGHPMGSQMRCTVGKTVPMRVAVTNRDGSATTGSLRLFTNGGVELSRLNASSGTFQVPVLPGRHWYFVRAHGADGVSTVYVAPVWIDGGAPVGTWLGGDMHVHTDHSSDGSALRQSNGDKAPGNVAVSDQIGEAEREGLSWLPLTDHRTYDQHYDPLWESSKLLLIPGEEANSSPHCTVHGAVDMVDQADAPAGSPGFRSVQQSLWSAHAQGAAFAVAHPDDGELNADGTPNTNANLVGMDSVEAWNRASNVEAEIDYAEGRWNRGYRFGINGGSDDHFRELWGASSPGTPRTHVFSFNTSERGILQGMRAGRFMLQLRPTGPFATLEADFQNDGVYEALQGDEVIAAAGTAGRLRVRVTGAVGDTVYLYKSPGRSQPAVQTWTPTGTDQTFTYDVVASAQPTWYRVEVRGPGEPAAVDTATVKAGNVAGLVNQNGPNERLALTSPIFVAPAPVEAQPESPLPADAGGDDGAQPAIGDVGAFAGFPAVADGDGGLHVVAEAHATGATQVVYRRRGGDGSLGEPVVLSDASTTARFPKVAAAGNNVWVVWEDERAGQIPRRKAIYLRQSNDNGRSWQPEVLVRSVAGRAEHPALAVTRDGHAVIAWQEIQAGKAFDIWAQVIGVDAAPVNVSGLGKTVAAAAPTDTRSAVYPASVWPALAVGPDGRIALGWQDNRTDADPLWTGASGYGNGTAPDNWQIQVSTRAGAGWGAPASLGANDRADRHPALAFGGDGSLVAAWDSKPLSAAGPNLTVLAALSRDGGQSWSAPALASGLATAFAQRPALARDGAGAVRLAWFDNRSSDWRWRVATAQLGGDGQWSAAKLINSRGVNTWPALSASGLVFASTRNAQRLQRDPTQQIVVLATVATAPKPFAFSRREGVEPSTFVTSEAVYLDGFTTALTVKVSGGPGAQVRVNNGPFTSDPVSILPGQKLEVRHLSASTESTETTTTVTVGTFSTPFTTVTRAYDHAPDAFDFGETDGVNPGVAYTSRAVTPANYDNAPITVTQASYSLDGGAFTTARGTISKGQSVRIQVIGSKSSLGYARGYVTVGGVKGTYTLRTRK